MPRPEWFASLSRALIAALAGLLAGAVAVAGWYGRSPAFALDFERDLPPVLSGVFRVEHSPGTSFAWTSPRAVLALAGLDRRVPWTCIVRARGARPPQVAPADLTMAVDGVAIGHRRVANDQYDDVTIDVPERSEARAPADAGGVARVRAGPVRPARARDAADGALLRAAEWHAASALEGDGGRGGHRRPCGCRRWRCWPCRSAWCSPDRPLVAVAVGLRARVGGQARTGSSP